MKQLCVSVFLVISLPAFAGGGLEAIPGGPRDLGVDHEFTVRLSDIDGRGIYDRNGEEIATVEDAILDIGSGFVAHLVIRFIDDSIRSPRELFPLPLYAVTPRAPDGSLMLIVDELPLRNMPTLEDITATQIADDDPWGRWIYNYWNTFTGTGNRSILNRRQELARFRYGLLVGPRIVPVALIRASEYLEVQIVDTAGRPVGTVADAVVNLQNGRLMYAFVDTDEGDHLVPIPAFSANRETGNIVYPAASYGFPEAGRVGAIWPELTDDGFHEDLERAWLERNIPITYGVGMRVVPRRTMTVARMEGYDVYTRSSASLGRVIDVIVEPDGVVPYILFQWGDVIGIGGRRSLVPFSHLAVMPANQGLLLELLFPELRRMPTFESPRFPDTSESDWDAALRNFWNSLYETAGGDSVTLPTVTSPTALPAGSPMPSRVLQNAPVFNAEGERLGQVEAVRLDLVARRVAYLEIRLSALDGAMVAVPVSSLTSIDPEEGVSLNATVQALRRSPGFGTLPEVPETGFIQAVDNYWP